MTDCQWCHHSLDQGEFVSSARKARIEAVTMEVRFGEQTYKVTSNDFLAVMQAFQGCAGGKWLEEEKGMAYSTYFAELWADLEAGS